jgi:hypothetical protein
MSDIGQYDHILIREGTVIVRVPTGVREISDDFTPEFFDVRTGVQLKGIYPSLQTIELHRGHLLSEMAAEALLRYRTGSGAKSKVVTMLEVKQRKLDSVVADSILDQLHIIVNILQKFLLAAEKAHVEEKLWLSQQVLTLVRKFSGRELAELEEIVDWFNSRPRKK